MKTTAKFGDLTKPVLRFDGQSVLEAGRPVPPTGTLFIVYQSNGKARAGERIVGWEDAATGKHGLGLMTDPSGKLHAILRKDGKSGDLVDAGKPGGFETVSISWGPDGTALRRNGVESSSKTIDGLSSDPKIAALVIGGPGSGASAKFTGDIAELRVYNRPLTDAERKQVEAELKETWFQPDDPRKPPRDPLAE